MRTVLARAYGGYGAVDAMSWEEYALARQLETELAIGTVIRHAKAVEDAQAKRAKKNIGGTR